MVFAAFHVPMIGLLCWPPFINGITLSSTKQSSRWFDDWDYKTHFFELESLAYFNGLKDLMLAIRHFNWVSYKTLSSLGFARKFSHTKKRKRQRAQTSRQHFFLLKCHLYLKEIELQRAGSKAREPNPTRLASSTLKIIVFRGLFSAQLSSFQDFISRA